MDPCVYTTQFKTWLRAASDCSPTKLVCIRSGKRWVTARKLLQIQNTIPILFRQQDQSTSALACQFVADLSEIHFAEDFENDTKRLAWLRKRLWLQRETIKKQDRTARFPTWKSQFMTCEIDKFMENATWYVISRLSEIKPLPLPRLRKLIDDRPLAANFRRGYALCRYPEREVRRLTKMGPPRSR